MFRIGFLHLLRVELIGYVVKNLRKVERLERGIFLRLLLSAFLTEMKSLFFIPGNFLNVDGCRIFFADVAQHDKTPFLEV